MTKVTMKTIAFFDTKAVTSRLDPATRKFLGWGGGLTRKIMKRSLKPARQKKVSELTDIEAAAYQKKVEWAKNNGLPKPRRPDVSAAPGEIPKIHARKPDKSPLKELIYYGLDMKTDTAVVGPLSARSGIVEKLEETHPFARRALEQVTPQIPDYWKNLITN